MASRKKGAAPHKPKKVYESVKLMNCVRCGRDTTHTLFDYDNGLYKCNVCGTVYTKRGK